jgi:Mn2+/Fe2+ NRAMP family transporter
MKYYIRRAILGIISIPFVAGAWCFVYLAFLILGGESNQTITETFENGLLVGVVLAVALTFAPQLAKFVAWAGGDK